jgi:hypothetical protein
LLRKLAASEFIYTENFPRESNLRKREVEATLKLKGTIGLSSGAYTNRAGLRCASAPSMTIINVVVLYATALQAFVKTL